MIYFVHCSMYTNTNTIHICLVDCMALYGHYLLGRITEWKKDKPGHSVSFACKMHSKCRVVKSMTSLPHNFQDRVWARVKFQVFITYE